MKRKVPVIIFVSIFLLATVASVRATISFESTINDNIQVVCNLTNLNQTVYDDAKNNQIFNGSTIAQTIIQNLKKQNRTDVTYGFQLNSYDDANRAIRVSFYLAGTDIITSVINQTNLQRNSQVKTDWREFQVNLTSSLPIDFATYFADPVDGWQHIDYTDSTGNVHQSFYFETAETEQFGRLAFRFVLPSAATNVQAQGDTITYSVPLGFEDVLLSSPFPILAIIIVVVVIALIYRRVR